MNDKPLIISLTGLCKAFVEDRVRAGGFASAEAYLESLFRAEYQRLRDQLQTDLQQGLDELNCGKGLAGKQVFDELREQLHRQATAVS